MSVEVVIKMRIDKEALEEQMLWIFQQDGDEAKGIESLLLDISDHIEGTPNETTTD